MSAVAVRPRLGVEEKPHCVRCDSEGRRLIKFKSPNDETHYVPGDSTDYGKNKVRIFSYDK